MGLRVNTNVAALAAQTSMTKVNRETEESFSKLSSGLRISKAADDAAGLAISEKLKAHIRSSNQANRNANDGVSMVQVAEGGLNETSNLLTRMRELAIQAASDTLTDVDRAMSSYEYEAVKKEIERISQVTEFNGKKLLDGSGNRLDFHVGVGNLDNSDMISFNSGKFNAGLESLGVSTSNILSKFGAQESLSRIDKAFDNLSSQRSDLGSIQNRLQSSSSNLGVYSENMSAANNRIRDLDYAEEASKAARNSIVQGASTAVAAQANVVGEIALKLV